MHATEERNPSVSRRGFLEAGAGGLALSMSETARARVDPTRATADAAIVVWLQGGLSQVDTFDPKPGAGPFCAIQTPIRGVFFSELLPQTAEVADKLCLIRSMSHDHATHEQAMHTMLTGRDMDGGCGHPCFLSIASRLPGSCRDMPMYVTNPGTSRTARLGFFGSGSAPGARGPMRITGLSDAVSSKLAASVRRAGAGTRRMYGSSPLASRLFRARHLVEAGARCVVVDDRGWDHHQSIESAYRRQVPALDRAFSGLIRDLDRRGMLARTMVLLLTEFGRAGRMNTRCGRAHCNTAFSVALAGGGFPGGRVIGATDVTASQVVSDPIRPKDLAAAVLRRLGRDAHSFDA